MVPPVAMSRAVETRNERSTMSNVAPVLEPALRIAILRYVYHALVTRARIAMFVFVAGTVTGIYFALQAHWNPNLMPPPSWRHAFGVNLTYYYLWALMTPIVVRMARRFRFESGRWAVAVLAHFLASAILTLI